MSNSLRRRVLVLVALTAFLVCLPQLASARFSGQQQASLSVGTAGMVAPSGVTGTYTCTRSGFSEGISVTITSVADPGPAGASYPLVLTGGNAPRATATAATSTSTTTLSTSGLIDLGSTDYTLTVTSRIGGWTGDPLVRTITCPAAQTRTGPL
ncbi:hypothetical protein [Nocardioides kribbensis]|uniref:hypothetical protein n=1 Tax=Nocardioides kribbensis TaxID=305517 RepID=UPI00187A1C4D|nr:hypothetical protein [Nocardioides kribbensis]